MNRFDELMFLIEKTSKKEKHRMDNFLKRHNYDPKTRSIETDEVGKDGKKISHITEFYDNVNDKKEANQARQDND